MRLMGAAWCTRCWCGKDRRRLGWRGMESVVGALARTFKAGAKAVPPARRFVASAALPLPEPDPLRLHDRRSGRMAPCGGVVVAGAGRRCEPADGRCCLRYILPPLLELFSTRAPSPTSTDASHAVARTRGEQHVGDAFSRVGLPRPTGESPVGEKPAGRGERLRVVAKQPGKRCEALLTSCRDVEYDVGMRTHNERHARG